MSDSALITDESEEGVSLDVIITMTTSSYVANDPVKCNEEIGYTLSTSRQNGLNNSAFVLIAKY